MSIEAQNLPPNYIKFLEKDISWSQNANKTYTGTQRIQVKFGDQEYSYTLTLSNISDRDAAKKELISQITTIMQVAINHGVVPNSKKSLEYSDNKFTKINADGVKKEIVDVDRSQQKNIYTNLKNKFTNEKFKSQITKEDLKDEESSIISAGLNLDKLIKNLPALLKNEDDWQKKLSNINTKIQRQQLLKQLTLYHSLEAKDELKPKPLSAKVNIQSDKNQTDKPSDIRDGANAKKRPEVREADDDSSSRDNIEESNELDLEDTEDNASIEEASSSYDSDSIEESGSEDFYTPSEEDCINFIEDSTAKFKEPLTELNNLSSQLKVLRYFNSSTAELDDLQKTQRDHLIQKVMDQLTKEVQDSIDQRIPHPLMEIFPDDDDTTIVQALRDYPNHYFNSIYDDNPLLFRTPFLEIDLNKFRFVYKLDAEKELAPILSILNFKKPVNEALLEASDMVKRKVIVTLLLHPETVSQLSSDQKEEIGQMINDDMENILNLNEKYLKSLDKKVLFFGNLENENIETFFTDKEKEIELYIRIFNGVMQGKIPETVYSTPVRSTVEKVRNWFTSKFF